MRLRGLVLRSTSRRIAVRRARLALALLVGLSPIHAVAVTATRTATSEARVGVPARNPVAERDATGGYTATATSVESGALDAFEGRFGELPPLALTVNDGLRGLEEEVIPSLVEERIEFARLTLLDNFDLECLMADASIHDTVVEAPLEPAALDGEFGNGGRVRTDVDIDASFESTFTFRTWESGGAGCDVVDVVEDVFDILDLGPAHAEEPFEELTFSARGFDAEIDLRLALEGDEVRLASIDKLEASIGSVSTSGTESASVIADFAKGVATGICAVSQQLADVLVQDEIADLLGFDGEFAIGGIEIDVAALAASDPVRDITDCANLVLDTVVLPSQTAMIGNAIDSALRQSLAFEEAVPAPGAEVELALAPLALTSSQADDTMTLEFEVDVTSAAATDPCAADLSWSAGIPTGEAPTTAADLDLEVPHWVVAKTLYELGRGGLFCFSDPATSFVFAPSGVLRVESGEEIVCDDNPPVCRVEHWNDLRVTVPGRLTGGAVGSSGNGSGNLVVYAKLGLAGRNVDLDVSDVDVTDVSAVVNPPYGGSFDVSTIVSNQANAAADAAFPLAIPLPLPRVTKLTDDFALEVGRQAVNDHFYTLGIDIVPARTWTKSTMDPEIDPRVPTDLDAEEIEPLDPEWEQARP
jgi:hypothetical protein